MKGRSGVASRAWLIAVLLALGFLLWAENVRVRRVEQVTHLVPAELARDPASPTGFRGGLRRLIVPEHNWDSYDWIAQTQQMLARGEWRVRRIDYGNAPYGHEIHAASPYRWWLGLIAWIDRLFSGSSPGEAVERAALFADPLLQVLLLVGATLLVARRFGPRAAALFSIGFVLLYPFGGGFLPGMPDDRGLARVCTFGSVLLLLAGIAPRVVPAAAAGTGREKSGAPPAARRRRGWFFAAGVVGGFGLWIRVQDQVPVLAGIALGALLAAWVGRADPAENATDAAEELPWRLWGLGGAAACLAAYLAEYFPAHLGSWQLRVNHPLYGLAWLGCGELLARLTDWIRRGKRAWSPRVIVVAILAAGALAALPVGLWKTHSPGFLAADLLTAKLTKLPGGVVADNFWAWLVRDGVSPVVLATVLPGLLVLPAIGLICWSRAAVAARVALSIALGPVLVAAGFAGPRLDWWNEFDGMLLGLLVAATVALDGAVHRRVVRWSWAVLVGLLFMPGAYRLLPPMPRAAANALGKTDARSLIERDLAHWLAKRAGPAGAVVLAPPDATAALHFFGGLRGLATLDWENKEGLVAAVRICSATTVEEAQELVGRRGVGYIVIPSWDSYLDEFARMGLGQVEGSFISRLQQWNLPLWLRPVAYQLPNISGLEGQSIRVFEVVDDQDEAVAASRRAEYFIDMGQLDLAAASAEALRRFPSDVGALVARLNVALAVDDAAGFAPIFDSLVTRLSRKADRSLPWERRLSLAVVLARGKRLDLARGQLERCLAEINEPRLRALPTGALYRLQVLSKGLTLEIRDARLRALALELLPPDLRSRL